jgi:hypothetical protein
MPLMDLGITRVIQPTKEGNQWAIAGILMGD